MRGMSTPYRERLVVEPGATLRLADHDPSGTPGCDGKKDAKKRLDNPQRQWRISPYDFEARKQWNDYMAAYEEALARCSTARAPWFVIPADNKWFRNLALTSIVVETLGAQDMQFTAPSTDISKIVLE